MEPEQATGAEPKAGADTDMSGTSSNNHSEATTNTEVPTTPKSTDPPEGSSVDGPTLVNSSPPFLYSEAEQKQMYVQDGLWKDFEDLGFDAELELRRTFDVRNVEQRELDTAVIRLALEQFSAREIAEMVIRMRGFEP